SALHVACEHAAPSCSGTRCQQRTTHEHQERRPHTHTHSAELQLHAIAAPPVVRDRTYASAMALREWFKTQGRPIPAMNVVSLGTHSRRTHFLFEHAFKPAIDVGMIRITDQNFEARRWWLSSSGFRMVSDELLAYLYVCLTRRAD
ncbi:MAG: hypothetical protein V4710_04570, partial [Verrucomicrobiota bacterium]